MAESKVGFKVRLIITGGFHYSGAVVDETDLHFEILDKFSKRVMLRKSDIISLEVLG